jgi:curved DNA-binding protein
MSTDASMTGGQMTAARAREILGVGLLASPSELRRAFLRASRGAHPDHVAGRGEQFREVVMAYQRLNRTLPQRIVQPPAVQPRPAAPARPTTLNISPLTALQGGSVQQRLGDGRVLEIQLPPGLRTGDSVRAGEVILPVTVQSDASMLVRGHDIWITVPVAPSTLAEGGRIALDTPMGRRIVWITKKAGERGLVRVVGQGLPARGRHPRGCLFIRLTEAKSSTDSHARALLRRFQAAWAA